MGDKLWKATERKIAQYLGGKRNPVNGSGAKCDISSDWLSIETKERRKLSQFLIETMAEAERNCEPGKLPIAVLHEKGKRHAGDLVMLRLKDFRNWFGG